MSRWRFVPQKSFRAGAGKAAVMGPPGPKSLSIRMTHPCFFQGYEMGKANGPTPKQST